MSNKGKYDDLCEFLIGEVQADGVMVIVLNGNRGTGFSASFTSPDLIFGIPKALRLVADQIEAEHKGQGGPLH